MAAELWEWKTLQHCKAMTTKAAETKMLTGTPKKKIALKSRNPPLNQENRL